MSALDEEPAPEIDPLGEAIDDAAVAAVEDAMRLVATAIQGDWSWTCPDLVPPPVLD